MEKLGWTDISSIDTNGWDIDYWVTFIKDSDREVMIHTLKGENVEVNGYFIPKNLDESIFYLTDLDVIPRN